jgi:citrate lyase beta subunit
MPGTKDIKQKIIEKKLDGITSIVMCMEDAIKEEDLETAENNILEHLDFIANNIANRTLSIDDVPLIFIRVRNVNQFGEFIRKITPEHSNILSGFVFPKFDSYSAGDYLKILEHLCLRHNAVLYGMPILEGRTIAFKETRNEELLILKRILEPYKQLILNIRVGGTDFSSIWGVRRGINYSIYDILTVRDCLSDILNFFNRSDDSYLVSAPVWEYFLAYKKDDINDLLKHDLHHSLMNRVPIVNEAIDGLLREVILDKANGFVGKTIIHPSHARFVNSMQAVTKEEYDDAFQIVNTKGGVIKSANTNKMNEINPHRSWADKIINCAKAFGVVKTEDEILKLIFEKQ